MVVLVGSFVCSQEISEAPSKTPVSLAAKKNGIAGALWQK